MSKTNTSAKGSKGEFPPQVGFWPAKNGSGRFTVYVDENVKAILSKAEVGGRLLLSPTPQGRIEEFPNVAHFQVTIFAPDSQPSTSAPKATQGDSL